MSDTSDLNVAEYIFDEEIHLESVLVPLQTIRH